jgi:hypothetical protein
MEEEFERQNVPLEPPTPTTPTTTTPPTEVGRIRKRVLSFRVNDPTPVPTTRTPQLAIQLGVVFHRPFSIWEWNGPTDRMQITLILVPHRTSVESFEACVRATSSRFYFNPDKYCFSDMFDVLYEEVYMTFKHEIADPRLTNEILVFYVPRAYFRATRPQHPSIYNIVEHLKTVCVRT